MRIALAQLLSGTDPAANLELVADYTRRAADGGARLVVFPEATMCRFGVALGPVAQPVDGPWADGVRTAADQAGIAVAVGMFTPSPDGRAYNTMLVTGGGLDTHYHKIHLYDAFGFRESDTVAPGFEPLVVDVDGVGVGITLCYDVRFPELYVDLARRGAALITVSASWGSGPGKLEQWTLLNRARALDSQCFVAACDQGVPAPELAGQPTGVGGSLVASPVGEVLVSAGDDPQLLFADIDPAASQKARDAIAVLDNPSTFARVDRAESRP